MESDMDDRKVLEKALKEKHPDPHRAVAAHMYKVSEDQVTPAMRQAAKSRNYFLLYSQEIKLQ